MWETLRKEWQAKAALLLFILLSLWWVVGRESSYQTRYFGDYPSIYGVMALWGAICGIGVAYKWGGMKSVLGRSILMFSLGLLAQEFGQIAYAYLSFFKHVEVPYPSIGDIGYFGSIPLYIYGVFLLAQASGVSVKLRSFQHKLKAIIIPLLMLGTGYFLFLQEYKFDWSSPLKILLDFGYPLAQAIYISVAILTYLLSQGVLGGIMKNKVLFILFALLVQFLSDYTFLYQSSKGLWSVGGINDYMYLCAYFLMTMGLLQFKTAFTKIKHA
jgi:hypothetical protein